MRETWVRTLGWEAALEKGKATHRRILAWRIPCTVQSMGSQRVVHDWATFTFTLRETHGDFLVAQCLRICLSVQGIWVCFLIRNYGSTCHRAAEPRSHNYWSLRALEILLCNKRSYQKMKSHVPQQESSSCSPKLEKVHMQQWRSSAAKNKRNFF